MDKCYRVNENIKRRIEEGCRKPSAVAQKAGIRKDVFSKIIHNKRKVHVNELVPISFALGCTPEDLVN